MEADKSNVLFVDDDAACTRSTIRGVLRLFPDFNPHTAEKEEEAIALARKLRPEVVVLDLNLDPGVGPQSGYKLIQKFLELLGFVRIIMLTGSVDDWGCKCVNAGAASYMEKPADIQKLAALIQDSIRVVHYMRSKPETLDEAHVAARATGLIAYSEKMKHVIDEIAIAAPMSQPILLCGETGVGKFIVAQAIHALSKRQNKPFVRMQPSFGNPDLIHSELFGYKRGAFTGAHTDQPGFISEADGGTLFLDEVDALPHNTQIELLHVIQEKQFQRLGCTKPCRSDFRLISATNIPFERLTDGSSLRIDFYHRIAHHVIHIPPLRERRADIPHLAQDILNRLLRENPEARVSGFASEALIWLSAQPWPGNVRELQAAIERAYSKALFNQRCLIYVGDLDNSERITESPATMSLKVRLRNFELSVVSSTFAKHHQNFTAAARELGVDRKRLRRILARAECR